MSYCTLDEAFSQPLSNLSNDFDKKRCKKNVKKSRINCNRNKTKFSENCYDTFDSLIKEPNKNSCVKSKSKSKSKKKKSRTPPAYDSDNLSQLLLENSDYGSYFNNNDNDNGGNGGNDNGGNGGNDNGGNVETFTNFDNFYENFSNKKKSPNDVFEYDKKHDRPIDENGNISDPEPESQTDEESDSGTSSESDEEPVSRKQVVKNKRNKKSGGKSKKKIQDRLNRAMEEAEKERAIVVNSTEEMDEDPSKTMPSQIEEINSKINFLINQINDQDDTGNGNSLIENNIHDIILFILFGVFIIIILESLYKLVFKICRKKYLS